MKKNRDKGSYLLLNERSSYSIYLQVKSSVDVIAKETKQLKQSWDLLNGYLYALTDAGILTDEELLIPLDYLSNDGDSEKILKKLKEKLGVK